jgi:very-short-patch-repair endonuclease
MTIHFNKSTEKQNRRELRKKQTPAEKLVWRYLRNKQMMNCKFRRQCSVDKFIIDFYCSELNLAIEIDGNVHEEPEQKEYDIERQKYLEKLEIIFLRIKNEELFGNPNKAFGKIEKFIKKITLNME